MPPVPPMQVLYSNSLQQARRDAPWRQQQVSQSQRFKLLQDQRFFTAEQMPAELSKVESGFPTGFYG